MPEKVKINLLKELMLSADAHIPRETDVENPFFGIYIAVKTILFTGEEEH